MGLILGLRTISLTVSTGFTAFYSLMNSLKETFLSILSISSIKYTKNMTILTVQSHSTVFHTFLSLDLRDFDIRGYLPVPIYRVNRGIPVYKR